jgi:hypothetical protein
MKKTITQISDYAALKKLAEALWKQDNNYHGAAIIVGAGFSRSAASTGNPENRLPLWGELQKALSKELGPGSSQDPLRIAEEYCAYFGRQALYDLVKQQINDAGWSPGPLYRQLLELPWTEVLTTNWDTLLERGSQEVHQPLYSLVAKQEDLSSSRSPRIVKLHGTVNATEHLVFTQEDYRKYPDQYAAFVNFARQVFIENELCLIGFSGDDPNFLSWAGWVRDQLSAQARRIYLVGALHLNAAKRKYLESINVSPIDLGEIVAEYDDHHRQHVEATRFFLKALAELEPKQAWQWAPTQLVRNSLSSDELEKIRNDAAYAAGLLDKQIPILAADRTSYPGWIVCPSIQRRQIRYQVMDPTPTKAILERMTLDNRAKLLFELAWRHTIAFELPQRWVIEEMLKVCDPSKANGLEKAQQLKIALFVLKSARWYESADGETIKQTAADILDKNAMYWPESSEELLFYKATVALETLDYQQVEVLSKKLVREEPEWLLRRSLLLLEIGKQSEAESLVALAHRQLLRQYRHNRKSVYILSRLAWADWLLRVARTLSSDADLPELTAAFQETLSDPWDFVESLRESVSRALDIVSKRQVIEPLFEAGHFRETSTSMYVDGWAETLLQLDGLSNSTGIPFYWDHVDVLGGTASRLSTIDTLPALHRMSLAVRAAHSFEAESIKRVFSRLQIACMQQSAVDEILRRCLQAVDYWRVKLSAADKKLKDHALTKLRVFIEVLARVVVRTSPGQAKEIFKLGGKLAVEKNLQHWRSNEPLEHLLAYSLESVPHAEHQELLLDALRFPLASEIGIQDEDSWPNPVIEHPGTRKPDPSMDREIERLIDQVSPADSMKRGGEAVLRLLPLYRQGFLTEHEIKRLAEKTWERSNNFQILPELGLLIHGLLELPEPEPGVAKRMVRSYLFEQRTNNLFDRLPLLSIVGAAQLEKSPELPESVQAVDYFNRMIEWRPRDAEVSPFSEFANQDVEVGRLIGEALAVAVVPQLPKHMFSEQNFEKLHRFYLDVKSPKSAIALVHFATANANVVGKVEKLLVKGMRAKEPNVVACSSFAILKWRELVDSGETTRLVAQVIYSIGAGRIAGLAGLLWTADQLLTKGFLTTGQINALADSVPMIFNGSRYDENSFGSRESISVSLIRAACVRLAQRISTCKELEELGELERLLDDAKDDPLPEVRFARFDDR